MLFARNTSQGNRVSRAAAAAHVATCPASMTKALALGVVTLAALTPTAAAQLACGYEVDIIFAPACGGELGNANGLGISEEGDICGEFHCSGGNERAFVSWNAVGLVPLAGFPEGTYLSVGDDMAAQVICGWLESTSLGSRFGFRWANGVGTSLGTLPGGNTSEASSINSQGVIVGAWGDAVNGPFPRAFRWQNGIMQDLSSGLMRPGSRALDINDHGAITGWMGQTGSPGATPGFGPHAFIWQDGVVTDLGLAPGSVGTEGWGINNLNQVAGVSWFTTKQSPGFVRRGFIWSNGVFTDLGMLSGQHSMLPRDISDDGTVVGFTFPSTSGFVWRAGTLRAVSEFLPSSLQSVACTAINSQGDIAAEAIFFNNPPFYEDVALRLRAIPREVGDTNCDGFVAVDDLLAVILNWGAMGSDADVNGSGIVDVDDLVTVILNWG